MDLCCALRQKSSVPIVMMTARGAETDLVLGLELGADDCLPKPFSGPELVARVRAVLRRSRMIAAESSLRIPTKSAGDSGLKSATHSD